jgi:hypothetical protein
MVGQFKTIKGKRLQVNKSQIKYKRELEYLTDILCAGIWHPHGGPAATAPGGLLRQSPPLCLMVLEVAKKKRPQRLGGLC